MKEIKKIRLLDELKEGENEALTDSGNGTRKAPPSGSGSGSNGDGGSGLATGYNNYFSPVRFPVTIGNYKWNAELSFGWSATALQKPDETGSGYVVNTNTLHVILDKILIIFYGVADDSQEVGTHYSSFHEERPLFSETLSGDSSMSFEKYYEQIRGAKTIYYYDERGALQHKGPTIEYFAVKITVTLNFKEDSSSIELENVTVQITPTN